ncbi:zinc finger protein 426-like isoform X2 [Sceloporus undulatus]|uniref:zinc finger protein 426-like isoform X2 n=1 Tax=Sceloporus undulatus TaxID=8520 RepID=UPI001C4A8D43|nr:zinc finger protein 426-like isoform X2 [Sceloporus undulatus]
MQSLQNCSADAISLGDRRLPGPRCTASALHSDTLQIAYESLDQVTFEEVEIRFSKEEWSLLDPDQRALHREVMEKNMELVASLGKTPSFSWLIQLLFRTLVASSSLLAVFLPVESSSIR